MSVQSPNISLTAQVEFVKGSAASGSRPRIHLVAYTGAELVLGNYDHPVVIDMASASFSKDRMPIVADHEYGVESLRLGYTTKQNIGDQITADGVITSTHPDAVQLVADMKAGFPMEVSVGGQPGSTYFVAAGNTVFLNGRSYEGPIFVAEDSVIKEMSVVLMGADSNTAASLAAKLFSGDSLMEFNQWVKALGHDPAAIDETLATSLKAQWSADQKVAQDKARLERDNTKLKDDIKAAADKTAPAPPADDDVGAAIKKATDDHIAALKATSEQQLELQAKEVERGGAIQAAFAKHADVEKFEVDGHDVDRTALQATAIRDGWTSEKVELTLLRASRSINQFNISTMPGAGKPNVRAEAIQAALLMQHGGIPDEGKDHRGRAYGFKAWFSDEALQAATGKEFDSYSLHQLMHDTIRASGDHYSGSYKSKDFIRATFDAQKKLDIQAGAFSTLGVTSILEDSANKSLLAAYNAQSVRWPNFSSVRTLNDFKTHGFYRLTLEGGYSKVPADGQIGHGQQSDQKFPVTPDTYGMIVGLTRQDIANDDLDAFLGIPTGLGRLASLALEFAFMNTLLTWDLSARQIGTVLGLDGLTEAAAMFMDSMDADNKPILSNPDRLLVGSQLEFTANELYRSDSLIALNTTAGDTREAAKNLHAGSYMPFASPLLSNAAITGMDGLPAIPAADVSTTQWFMGTNPNDLAGMFVGFVGGNQTPVIESSEMMYDRLGIQWRSYHDWGIGTGDENAFVYSTGT